MAKSKNNTNRKSKQENFKQTRKNINKSIMTANQNKQVFRKPTWSAASTFQISGQELEALSNFINPYRELVATVDRVLLMGEISGDIVNEYVYADGSLANTESNTVKTAKAEREQYIENTKRIMTEYEQTLSNSLSKIKESIADIPDIDNESKVITLDKPEIITNPKISLDTNL